jgi:hypothetical protein
MAVLALSAVCAISAIGGASAAQGKEFWFQTEPAEFTEIFGGGEEHEFTFDGGVLHCGTAEFEGSVGGGPTGFYEPKAKYSECKFAGLPATVNMNGCFYSLLQDNNTGNGEYDVTTQIVCPLGKEITITSSMAGITRCTIHIPPQALGTGVSLANDEDVLGTLDFDAVFDLVKIKYSQTAGSGIGKCTTADATANGTYEGFATFLGFNELGLSVNIWLE